MYYIHEARNINKYRYICPKHTKDNINLPAVSGCLGFEGLGTTADGLQ